MSMGLCGSDFDVMFYYLISFFWECLGTGVPKYVFPQNDILSSGLIKKRVGFPNYIYYVYMLFCHAKTKLFLPVEVQYCTCMKLLNREKRGKKF